ncbi:TetR/AcrR family transcriptional regulator [Variovorax saccharolyticus]|uniref:TetR/AcrR family transcriptional regulator n=1 Tax=Variovorax saccharolyticus TaxID=3053516 RepID=UPI00257576AC|nr:TetR/AcrR family transcriptional regulator [Variovorax sp. J22R187]MDM0020892.1 TetR/AcrR family transcriptional regulator [Variovorax sp. J22R187]
MSKSVHSSAFEQAAPAPMTVARRRIHAAAMGLFTELGVTRVSISELAAAAGMARGTIYANVADVDKLFEEVAAQLVRDMAHRVVLSFPDNDDPARNLSIGVRQYIRRAHDEPLWGRFMNRFGLSNASLQAVWATDPVANLRAGIASGRYKITEQQLPSMVGMLTGGTLAAMFPVLEGHGTWREVGANTAELALLALGLPRKEAKALARSELPQLPPATDGS